MSAKNTPSIVTKSPVGGSVTYLNCPFSEKDQVKALGARFDSWSRKWYISKDTNQTPFKKWLGGENTYDKFFDQDYSLPGSSAKAKAASRPSSSSS